MKRNLSILSVTAFTCLILALYGCVESGGTHEPALITLLVDSGNGSSLAISDAEQIAEWYTWTQEIGTVPEKKTIVFEDVTYEGKYTESFGKEGYEGLFDSYLITNAGEGMYFVVDRSSGEIVELSLYSSSDYEEKEARLPIPENPKENSLKEAEKWAKKLLNDPENYERIDLGHSEYYYMYRYVRKFGDTEMRDFLGMMISDRGGLICFAKYTANWGKEAEQQLEILKTAPVEELIQAELSKQNASLAEIYDSYYGRTPDGKVVLIVNCSVRVEDGMTTGAKFLVGIE